MDIIGENGIIFFKGGGHSHDGENSSPVDTVSYSIFDFNLGLQTNNSDTNREYSRSINQQTFNQYIKTFISSQVLEPAGILLGENSIRGSYIGADEINATHIAANTITANEIAANTITGSKIAAGTIDATKVSSEFIVVGDTISSNNYIAGTVGWSINSSGTADFRTATIGGWTVNSNAIFAGTTVLYSNGKTNLVNPTVTTGLYTGGTWTGGTVGGITVGSSQLTVGNSTFGTSISSANSAQFGAYLASNRLEFRWSSSGFATVTASANAYGGFGGFILDAISLAFDANNMRFNGQAGVTSNSNMYFYIPSVAVSTGSSLQLETSKRMVVLTSTKELKKNITTISNALEKICLLRPVTFNVRYNKNASELEKFLKDSDTKSGFIVEEIEKIDKGFVSYLYSGQHELPVEEWFEDPTNFTLGMYDLHSIVSWLTAAVQELAKKVEDLEENK